MYNICQTIDWLLVVTHLWRYPGRVIHLALLLEAELGVCHVDPGHQLVVGHAVDLQHEGCGEGGDNKQPGD